MKGDIPEVALRALRSAKRVETHERVVKERGSWQSRLHDPFGCRRVIPIEKIRGRREG